MAKEFFKSGHRIGGYLQKRCFARKKESYLKKSTILKNSKTFFMDLRFGNLTYMRTSFRLKKHYAASSSRAGCVGRIFVNLIFISCHYNNDQIKKIIKWMPY